MKIALATCMKLPEPDVDEHLLVNALAARGATVRLVAWDDAAQPPVAGELVVLRSTWNYFEDVEGFLAWVDRTGSTSRLLNPPAFVRTNAKKTYLRDLALRGIDVVPTEYATRGAAPDLDAIMREREWETVVIKPVVSAGSFRTERFESARVSEGQRFLDELVSTRDAMIQSWMPSVDTYGERSLVWIDGEVTHAVRKSARFAGSAGAHTAAEVAPEERAFAERVLAVARPTLTPVRSSSPLAVRASSEPGSTDLLYARVDIVRGEDGVLRLMELELIEPSLFLKECPRALDRLTNAIVRRASADLA